MDTWLLRFCNPTLSEPVPALPATQEPLAIAAQSRPEVDSSIKAHSQYVEMVNFLYGFTVTLG